MQEDKEQLRLEIYKRLVPYVMDDLIELQTMSDVEFVDEANYWEDHYEK